MIRCGLGLIAVLLCSHALAFDPLLVAREIPPPPDLDAVPLDSALSGDSRCPPPRRADEGNISLPEVVRRALCTDPRTRDAWAGIAARAAELGQARASYLPSLDAVVSRSDQTQDTRQANLHVDSDTRSNSLNLELGWTLFDFGQRSARTDSAHQALLAALASRDSTLQQVFLDAATAYYNLLSAQGALAVADEIEQINLKGYMAADAKHAAGVGNLTEKLQTQTALGQAVLARIQAEGQVLEARGRLALLIGESPDLPLRLDDDDAQLPDTDFVTTVSDMLEKAQARHPDLRAARAQVDAAQAQLRSTERAHLPTLRLSASQEQLRSQLDHTAETHQRNQLVALELNIPIFDGFGRHYATRGAEAALMQAQAQLDDARQRIAREVWLAYHALETGTRTVEKSAELVGFATHSLKVAQGRYKAGVGGTLELLEAQRALADAAQQRITALATWRAVRLRLAASLGRLGFWTLTPEAEATP